MNTEPALAVGGTTSVIQAAVAALIAAGGFNLSGKQEGAILAATTLVIGLLSAFLVRMHVFSPATVENIMKGQATTAAASLGVGSVIPAGPVMSASNGGNQTPPTDRVVQPSANGAGAQTRLLEGVAKLSTNGSGTADMTAHSSLAPAGKGKER